MSINHILISILTSLITIGVLLLINRKLKKKVLTPGKQKDTPTNLLIKRIIFLLLCFTLPACAFLMIGPQIMIIAPLSLCLGVYFVFRRSFLSLVCLGYPLCYGLVSAYIGYCELKNFTSTPGFWVALGIGIVGVDLIAVGLLKTFFKKNHS
jgi:4-amino-4-deoxy-L-arabinose transferase-like glycosyltransferase